MNKTQYAAFQAAIEHNLKGLDFVSTGVCPGCEDCGLGEHTCPYCDGEGIDVEQPDNSEPDRPCPKCNGEGLIKATDEERELAEEPHFSRQSCECCGSGLGGARHPAHGRDKNGELVHFEVCGDCLYFLNFGQLDDLSMMEMENS